MYAYLIPALLSSAILLPAQLEGEAREIVLASEAMGEDRVVTVYLPPGHDPAETYPVVYLADGETTPELAARLEPLIAAGAVPPTVLVGAHSAWSAPGEAFDPARDRRSAEYLIDFGDFVDGVDPQRFAKHERFFVEELSAWAEAAVGASPLRSQRAVFGSSSGAALAVTLAQRHADRYGHVIAFSLGWRRAIEEPDWHDRTPPRFYLWAGELEKDFLDTTSSWAEYLTEAGIDHVLRTGQAGHDEQAWQDEFASAVAWALGEGTEGRKSAAGGRR